MYYWVLLGFFVLFSIDNSYSYVEVNSCQDINNSMLDSSREVRLNTSISNQNGNCFTFSTNNVTFDCQGFEIDGDEDTNGNGFDSNSRTNLTIQNCNVRGFDEGISLEYTNYSRILNSNFTYNGAGVRIGPDSDYNLVDGVYSAYTTSHSNGAFWVDCMGFDQDSDYNVVNNSMVEYCEDNGISFWTNDNFNVVDNTVFNEVNNSANPATVSFLSNSYNNTVMNSRFYNTNGGEHISSSTTTEVNFIYNNYFDNSTLSYDTIGVDYSINISGVYFGNYWEAFTCSTWEQRGNYEVCISPNNFSGFDLAPLNMWYNSSAIVSESSSQNTRLVFPFSGIYSAFLSVFLVGIYFLF